MVLIILNTIRRFFKFWLVVLPTLLAWDTIFAQQDTEVDTEVLMLNGVTVNLETDFFANLDVSELNSLDRDFELPVLTIVRFNENITPEVRDGLGSQGITIEEFLGGKDYLLSISRIRDVRLVALEAGITSGAMLPAESKIASAADFDEAKIIRQKFSSEGEETNDNIFSITFAIGVSEKVARDILSEFGGELVETISDITYTIEVEEEALKRIAELHFVRAIGPPPTPFLPLNDWSRLHVGADMVQKFSLENNVPKYEGFSGLGVRIGVSDSGVDENHGDFFEIDASGNTGSSRVYSQRSGGDKHGTHVASIAVGSGLRSADSGQPAYSYRGIAPRAEVGDYDYMGGTLSRYAVALNRDATDVSNHSYVESRTNGYDTTSALIDQIIRGDATHQGNRLPARPQVWAAGNNGITSQYGNEEGFYAVFTEAKNSISVGSFDSLDGRISDFSSFGPTFDGRIKPDLVAPGCRDSIPVGSDGVQAARDGSQKYRGACGTSMAAPVISGVAALMTEAFRDANPGETLPRPSTYKAVLIQTADDLIKTTAYSDREYNNPDLKVPAIYFQGPDYVSGYGAVNAQEAVRSFRQQGYFLEDALARSGQSDQWCIDAPAGGGALRVTLAWDDEPGSTTTAMTVSKLVNDLDLSVSGVGQTTLPWTLDPLPVTSNAGSGDLDPISLTDIVPARRGVDRRNNVEVVDISSTSKGEYRVVVKAHSLPNGKAQLYSLAANMPIKSRCHLQVVMPDICKMNPRYCGIIPDIVTSIDPDWRRTMPDYRNAKPVRDICKYVLDCPGCGDNGLCPGFVAKISGLPKGSDVVLFEEKGNIIGRFHERMGDAYVEVESYRLGEEPLMGLIPPSNFQRSSPSRELDLKFKRIGN